MATAGDKLRVAGVVVLMLWSVPAFGQARSRYKWKEPTLGGIRTVGGDFSNYSSGMGGLRQSSGTGMGGVLSSSLMRSANYNLQHSAAGTTALGTALPKISGLKGRTYGSTKIKIDMPALDRAPGAAKVTRFGSGAVLTNVKSNLAATTRPATTTRPQKPEPIASLVPGGQGRYQTTMNKGEQAFRAERYVEAAEAFDVAISMGRRVPETHLSLVHAYSALGRYHSAAYHLRQALKYFPELPLVYLRVRMFYGRAGMFVNHMEKLRAAADKPRAETDLLLLLAYYRYFDGDEADAAKLLRKAMTIAEQNNNAATAETIETFWHGMAVAGKVTGDLTPAATTKPARPAARRGAGAVLPGTRPPSAHKKSPPPAKKQPATRPAAAEKEKGENAGSGGNRPAE